MQHLCFLFGQKGPIGDYTRLHLAGSCIFYELEYIFPQQGLSPGEKKHLDISFSQAVQNYRHVSIMVALVVLIPHIIAELTQIIASGRHFQFHRYGGGKSPTQLMRPLSELIGRLHAEPPDTVMRQHVLCQHLYTDA